MGVRVLREQCPTCIFRPGNQMQLERGRVHDMVKTCVDMGGMIPCHQALPSYIGDWSGVDEDAIAAYELGDLENEPVNVLGPDGQQVVCRGFWDRYRDEIQLLQLAERMDYVEVVELPPVKT